MRRPAIAGILAGGGSALFLSACALVAGIGEFKASPLDGATVNPEALTDTFVTVDGSVLPDGAVIPPDPDGAPADVFVDPGCPSPCPTRVTQGADTITSLAVTGDYVVWTGGTSDVWRAKKLGTDGTPERITDAHPNPRVRQTRPNAAVALHGSDKTVGEITTNADEVNINIAVTMTSLTTASITAQRIAFATDDGVWDCARGSLSSCGNGLDDKVPVQGVNLVSVGPGRLAFASPAGLVTCGNNMCDYNNTQWPAYKNVVDLVVDSNDVVHFLEPGHVFSLPSGAGPTVSAPVPVSGAVKALISDGASVFIATTSGIHRLELSGRTIAGTIGWPASRVALDDANVYFSDGNNIYRTPKF